MNDAQYILEILNKYEEFLKLTPAEKMVEAIFFDILGRRGLKEEFSQIEKDVQNDIKKTWKEIITQIAEDNSNKVY